MSFKVIENCTIRTLGTVKYSHRTMAISCIVSELKRDIGRKSRVFHTPPTFDAPLGGLRRSIAITFGVEKLEWCGHAKVKKKFDDNV